MEKRIGWKEVLIILFDIIAVNASYFLAIHARFYGFTAMDPIFQSYLDAFWKFAPFYTFACILVFFCFKLYFGMWKYAGLNDLNRIIAASFITCIIHVLGTSVFIKRMPCTYYFLGAVFQFLFICVIRLGYRVFLMERAKLIRYTSPSENVMIIGNASNAKKLMEYLEQDHSRLFRPVCIVDDKEETNGKILNGVPVIGKEKNIEFGIEKYKVRNVFIADPVIDNDLGNRIDKICRERSLNLQDFSGYLDYLDNKGDILDIVQIPKVVKVEGKETRIVPFSPPDIGKKEINEVIQALSSGWITTGPRTKMLERRLAAYIETGRTDIDTESDTDRWDGRVACLNSATAAEELNLRIWGIREGDEVIVPAYTYTATASAAIHCGATVRFVDIQKDGDIRSHCPEMDYEALENAITDKTKAIIPVDLGGIVCDYDRIFEIAERKRNIFKPLEDNSDPLSELSSRIQKSIGRIAIICDAAHALGASRVVGGEKKYVGAIADFTSFSFHAVKNFTTAEGGAATWLPIEGVTNQEIYKYYQLLSLHGQNKDALAKTKGGSWEYDIIGPWYKCNMTDIMAAIGLMQLDRYLGLLDRRLEIINKYDKVCEELGLSHLIHHVDGMDSSNHLYLVRLPGFNEDQRNQLIGKLTETGVATNVHYKPLPMMTAYKKFGWDIKDFPNAHDYYHNLITLPLHTKLSDEDVEYVCLTLRNVLYEIRR